MSTEITGSNYLWNTGSKDQTINVSVPGIYTLEISENKCTSIHNFNLISRAGTDSLPVPNIITPNNDGYNDFFNVNLMNASDFNISFLSRWGVEVFQSNDPSVKWDGQYNGNPLPAGTYYYIISYKEDCNNT